MFSFSVLKRKDNQSLSQNQSTPFVEPKYYSLLQIIADKYNDQMFGFPDVLTMTHNQKMKIGQYLASGYVTSAEVLNMIERIPKDSASPLAYLLKSLENLKQERLYEQKEIAHRNAKPRRHFTDDFKQQIVDLHQAGRKRSELIQEYDLTPSTFDKWVKQARTTGSFKSVDNLTDEQRELIALRKRNKELEMQVDILKQAAVIMAQKGK